MEFHKASAPEPLRNLTRYLPGTLRNLTTHLHQNPPEPHEVSAPNLPEPHKVSAPEPLRNLTTHLHQNPPEPHEVSAPEPSGTSRGICTRTLRNLVRNLVLKLHRIAQELIWAKDPIAKFCCWGKKQIQFAGAELFESSEIEFPIKDCLLPRVSKTKTLLLSLSLDSFSTFSESSAPSPFSFCAAWGRSQQMKIQVMNFTVIGMIVICDPGHVTVLLLKMAPFTSLIYLLK